MTKATATGLLAQLKEFAEAFSEERLRPYIERLRRSSHISTAPKEVNDAIWGTVKVHPLEVVVLDSPLVQRLRFIRQLGVVHWVYPGATHARFEHTLGVLFQAQQLVNAINQAAISKGHEAPIDNQRAGLIRLCAMLHDTGHGIFSHVSEHALAKRPDITIALGEFRNERSLEGVQLSEVMAYFFIGSPSFVEMLQLALDKLNRPLAFSIGSKENAIEISGLVQKAIIGQLIDETVPLLHELITGPFDSDKLDYYSRDARMAGIPPLVDISRLTQKITVERVPTAGLPTLIAKRVSSRSPYHFIFGLKWSGASILDELHLARVLLYSKIYRHQKVLAAEAMVEALFDALGSSPEVRPHSLVALCYEFSDDQLLWSDPDVILAKVGAATGSDLLRAFVGEIILRLRDRQLFVAALTVQARYPSDPWYEDDRQRRGLDDLLQDLMKPNRAHEFKQKVLRALLEIHKLEPTALGDIDPLLLPNFIVVMAKPTLKGGTEIDRAFIFQSGVPTPYGGVSSVYQSAWANAYDFSAAPAILFCPRECASAVYIAAERIIREEYDVILPATALELSKQNPELVTSLKRALETTGWYDGVPLDIRAEPAVLGRGDVPGIISRAAEKVMLYDEPAPAGAQRRPKLPADRVKDWLQQFRTDRMIECAMSVLEELRILGREDTVRALTSFSSAHPKFNGGTISLLGGLKDSSAVQAYLSHDLAKKYPRIASVSEATQNNYNSQIIFLDDFIGSGGQAKDILNNWFEIDDVSAPSLGEVRLPFTEAERQYLKSREIAFVFVAGWHEGAHELSKKCDELGLRATIYVDLKEEALPFAFGNGQHNRPPNWGEFEKRCEEIGRQLLSGKPQEKVDQRALGYGNRAMLLASRFNVPTQSLTCIWKNGFVDGVEWHALMTRRDKG